jgi:2-polyprenyl-3-methyl-5-hydroxy-6-metoxy-1,4-benzoquinol methylase
LTRLRKLGKRLIPAPYRPAARRLYEAGNAWIHRVWPSSDYADRKREELRFFTEPSQVNELPAIAHYWWNKYLIPILEPLGFTNTLECFRPYLLRLCQTQAPETVSFLSIGAGSCDAEINMARWLHESGSKNFSFECADINDSSIDKARQTAAANGVDGNFAFSLFDVNKWKPKTKYHAILALQSLHHVVELELLFERIARALHDDGYFLADDMIGRNGHQRWPEALQIIEELWKELPSKYKYNQQLRRFEEQFGNWDCSTGGFEGIRAQDVLPLLVQRFHFEIFVAFGNVIDIFIDRSFGHNFDPSNEWDRSFIDRVHAVDVWNLEQGIIKPTHILAVMKKTPVSSTSIHKHFSPQYCIRVASKE